MILWRDVKRLLENRYEIAKVNYQISRCMDCESTHCIRLCETHRVEMANAGDEYAY